MNRNKTHDQVYLKVHVFLTELHAHGLKHLIISPGSRSTPLTLAASTIATLNKHVVLDERSAAFLALGIAKATGKPAALICTSGTAVANYFPAVVEANKSGVPLLLLTADRPARLHGTGANQTINQQRIFGDHCVSFQNMDNALSNDTNIDFIKDIAVSAYNTCVYNYGPSHLNFPFSKPLEPTKAILQSTNTKNSLSVSTLNKRTKASLHLNKNQQKTIESSKHPLIVIGQLMPSTSSKTIFRLGRKLNAPILSEQQLNDGPHSINNFDGFLRNENNQTLLKPDLILRFGLQPASKSLLQALKKWNSTQHIYFTEDRRNYTIDSVPTKFIDWNGRFIDNHHFTSKNENWLKKWKNIEKQFQITKNDLLAHSRKLTDGHIYHHLSPALPEDWFVFIANSFPARDRSLFGRWNSHQCFTNRGASGIDGITSTAMGINIGLNKPGVLFTGDLSFLHDTNALLNHKKLAQSLIIVVINNRGGSLFRMLPVAEYREQFTPYFETPQSADIQTIAQSYDIPVQMVSSVKELKRLGLPTLADRSTTKLQIVECQTDADASMKLRNKLWDFES